MSDTASFAEFIRRIRAGDARAAEELVRRYETTIRVAVRARLTSDALKRRLDSVDVCQSVLHSFFVRMAAGQFDVETPQQLAGLLAGMARKKLLHQARKARHPAGADPNAVRLPLEDLEVTGNDPSPSTQAEARELLEKLRQRLSEEERRLMELRGEGRSWPEIAKMVGGTAEGRRKQLARALEFPAQDLGLIDAEDNDAD